MKKLRWGVLGVARIATKKVIPGMAPGCRRRTLYHCAAREGQFRRRARTSRRRDAFEPGDGVQFLAPSFQLPASSSDWKRPLLVLFDSIRCTTLRDVELLRLAARNTQRLPARTSIVLGQQDDLTDVCGVMGCLASDGLEHRVRFATNMMRSHT